MKLVAAGYAAEAVTGTPLPLTAMATVLTDEQISKLRKQVTVFVLVPLVAV